MPTKEEVKSALILTGESIPDRAVRRPEMLKMFGLCSTTQWREEKAGRFPRRRELTPGGTCFWLLSELNEHLLTRPLVGV